MEAFLAERAPEVAFYSEDRGMVSPAGRDPSLVLIVDPIDGTRPALAGFEAACVSVAAAPLDGEPTMGDVEVGCIVEIKSGARFVAERGGGLDPAPSLSGNVRLERMFWTYGLRGRPARADGRGAGGADRRLLGRRRDLRPRLGDLRHDPDRHRPARRLRRAGAADGRRRAGDAGRVRARRRRRGAQQLPLRPRRRGDLPPGGRAVVTDAYGQPLDSRPLLGSGAEFQISCIAAANPELHAKICASIEAGIERLAALSGLRAEPTSTETG